MIAVPIPAAAGSKVPLVTPLPLYVPPAGLPPVSAKGASVVQTGFNVAIVTVGSGLTVTSVAVEVPEQDPLVTATE